jgi:hypothetical protein
MAFSSFPQTLPCLVDSGDDVLACTGLFIVIIDAFLYILLLKCLSGCVITVNGSYHQLILVQIMVQVFCMSGESLIPYVLLEL